MAFTKTKNSVSIKLDNGTDGEGNQRVVGISLGDLSSSNDITSAATITDIMYVIAALAPCLDKEVYSVHGTVTGNITNS